MSHAYFSESCEDYLNCVSNLPDIGPNSYLHFHKNYNCPHYDQSLNDWNHKFYLHSVNILYAASYYTNPNLEQFGTLPGRKFTFSQSGIK